MTPPTPRLHMHTRTELYIRSARARAKRETKTRRQQKSDVRVKKGVKGIKHIARGITWCHEDLGSLCTYKSTVSLAL